MFTNNNVVTRDTILVGNINYQITGLPPFTDQPLRRSQRMDITRDAPFGKTENSMVK